MNSTHNVDPKAFRQALGAFATGVTVITTRAADGSDAGITASSFNSVSLDPPLILWSQGKDSDSFSIFRDAEYFAVHVLAENQRDISDRFAFGEGDKFNGLKIERGIGGVALLDGSAARFVCRSAARYEGGDHVIIVGEVLEFEAWSLPPLIFCGGRYAALAQ
ncbi:MAG: flavin reductase family protein [Porticoccaceae bacterium]|nr:flavin reductase family protein [Porticoccaceae bacterium]